MRKSIEGLHRIARRGMALCMAAALVFTMPLDTSHASATKKTKPTLSTAKRTLYYNVSGRKNYTLRLKKNSVKMIVLTNWKTSSKKIVSLSKKKDTSVKLTAKRKGKATITATVKYVPKGSFEIKKLKLKCRVTSKEMNLSEDITPNLTGTTSPVPTDLAAPSPTGSGAPEPTDIQTPGPTGNVPDASETPKPTDTPKPDDAVTEVTIDKEQVLLGIEEEKNSVTLTAFATRQDGMHVEDADIVWTSDREDVAIVDESGVVTAVSGGTANIIASVNGVFSAPCVVSVDDVLPTIEGGVITDYRTFTVYFTEPVFGIPSVSVNGPGAVDGVEYKQSLAEDGKTMTIVAGGALSAGTYNIVINGLSDLAGNGMEKDACVLVEKEKSIPEKFIPKTERVPAGVSSFAVYFAVLDQYGQEFDGMSIMSGGELKAEARTLNGMPFKTKVDYDNGYITVSGSSSAFVEGRVIEIKLTYAIEGQTICDSVMSVMMVDASGKGKPVKFEELYATSAMMGNVGTADAPEFILTENEKDNVFDLSAKFLDEFGYVADPADVTYMIDDKSVLAFADVSGTNSQDYNTSENGVKVRALRDGTATITAYLSADDSLCGTITVKVKPTSLSEVKVEKIDDGINGSPSDAKVTLIPGGSGITADKLKYDVIKGGNRIKDIKFMQDDDGIYVRITAKTDSLEDEIQFRVRYDMGTEDKIDDVVSNIVTYKSVPLSTPAAIEIDDFDTVIAAGDEAATTYRILNRYGEDITKLAPRQIAFRIGDNKIIKDVTIGTDDNVGTLTVQAQHQEGTTDIELYLVSNPSISNIVHVNVKQIARVDKIVFGKLSENNSNVLALNDTDNTIYVPVEAYNQYGIKYEHFTKTLIYDNEIIVTVDGRVQDDELSDVKVIWCKKEGESYVEAEYGDDITAVGIAWKNKKEIKAKNGDELAISFKSNRFAMSEADKFYVSVKPERKIDRLEFSSDYKAAVIGAHVTNTITVFDQYGRKCDIGADNVGVDIMSAELRPDSYGTVYESDMAGKCEHGITCVRRGTYIVRAFVKDDEDTTYDNSSARGSYTLIVDDEQMIIKRVEISEEAEIVYSNHYPVKQILLKGQYINVMCAVTPVTSVTFKCRAFTTYNGNEVEVALRNKEGEFAIDGNGLVWSADATGNVSVQKSSFGEFKISINSSSSLYGNVKVSLDYLPNKLGDIIDVPVSCDVPKPQNRHKITVYEDGVPGAENLMNVDYKMKKDSQVKFALLDIDQYNEVYEGINLYTVLSPDNNAVVIDIDKMDVGSESGPNRNTFTVKFGDGAELGGTYEIMVYVTKDIVYRFTVTMVETPAESVELSESEIKLFLGLKETSKLTSSVLPANATNRKVKWISDNPDVVKVTQSGLVTAVSEGKATITAETVNGKKDTCTVIVGVSKKTEIPQEDDKLVFAYLKDGEECEASVNLKALDNEIEMYGDAWGLADDLINKVTNIGLNDNPTEKYIDIDGDGEYDSLSFKKITDNEAQISVTVGDVVKNVNVTFLKTGGEEAPVREICAKVAANSDKEYLVSVRSDNTNKIFIEKTDGEAVTIEKTYSGYVVVVSDGLNVKFDLVQ